jgi:hypothetical protein
LCHHLYMSTHKLLITNLSTFHSLYTKPKYLHEHNNVSIIITIFSTYCMSDIRSHMRSRLPTWDHHTVKSWYQKYMMKLRTFKLLSCFQIQHQRKKLLIYWGYGSSFYLETNIRISDFISLTETEPELKYFYNKGYAWRFHFTDTYSSISDSEFSVWYQKFETLRLHFIDWKQIFIPSKAGFIIMTLTSSEILQCVIKFAYRKSNSKNIYCTCVTVRR